jgi:flagellar protein FliS
MAGRAPQNAYLSTQIKTASKEQLLLMLFDGAIRFAHQTKAAIEAREIENASNASIKVQNIVNELMSSLDQELIAPELYRNLMSLYSFVHKRMVNANLERNAAAVDEAVEVLTNLRGVWQEAISQVLADNGGKMPAASDRPMRVEASQSSYQSQGQTSGAPLSPSIIGTPRGGQAGPRTHGMGRIAGAQVYASQPAGQVPLPGTDSPTGAAASQKFPLPPGQTGGGTGGGTPPPPRTGGGTPPPPRTGGGTPPPPRTGGGTPPPPNAQPGRPAFQPPAAAAPARPPVPPQAPAKPTAPAGGGMQRPKINLNKK